MSPFFKGHYTRNRRKNKNGIRKNTRRAFKNDNFILEDKKDVKNAVIDALYDALEEQKRKHRK